MELFKWYYSKKESFTLFVFKPRMAGNRTPAIWLDKGSKWQLGSIDVEYSRPKLIQPKLSEEQYRSLIPELFHWWALAIWLDKGGTEE